MDLELPGGVITTHCVSTVIRPGSKVTHDPLQFVKIQSTELSKKAVEQIRLAEQVKITKDKIKEVEEEWQNNLLNWKSKRRQSRSVGHSENSNSSENSENEAGSGGRKIKTFSEILNEKAKSGYRIGYNLQRYINAEDSEDEKFASVDNSIDRKTETHVDKTIISQETELCDREVERIANRSDEHSDGSDVHDKDETTIDTPSDEGYNGRSSQCESAELRVTPESSSTLSESPIDAAATVATTLTTVTATIISTSLSTDPVPRQKPVIPPKPVIGERKSLPAVDVKIDQHNQLNHHQLIGRTNSDSIATIKSDKITNNYFRFTTKPYNNPRVTQGNGSKPVICHQDFLSSISSSPSPSPSSSSPLLSSFQESNNTKNSSNSNSNNNSSTNSSNNLNNSDLRKASFKHLGLSPQTSNSSITSNGSSSYNGSAIFHETIGRSVSSPLSQGTPQVIDSTVNCSSVNNNNNYNSINNNNNIENDSKRSNYPNILISPFKAHRPIINSVSSENLSNSQRSSSSSYPLGEKARSEAQLIKKSNENNLKSQDQRSMLSISGKKRCSNCGDELGRGCAAMVIETLSLYYHINCFRCCVCHIQLGNGTCGTDVRVRSNRIHCQNCYSNDEIGLTRV